MMKAVGVTGPDFTPRLFDIDEPVAARDGVVVEVMAASVNDFDRAAAEGRYIGLTGQLDPVLLGRDFVGRVADVGDGVDYIDAGMYVAGTLAPGRSGTFTEMVEVPAELLAPVPDALTSRKPPVWAWLGSRRSTRSARSGHNLRNTVIHGPVSGRRIRPPAARHAAPSSLQSPAGAGGSAWKLGADVVHFECKRGQLIRRCGTFRRRRRYRHPRRRRLSSLPGGAPGWEVHLGHRHRNGGCPLGPRIHSDNRRPERAQAGRSAL